MKKPPIRYPELKPPHQPILQPLGPFQADRMTMDQNHIMWIFTGVRRRSYICSKGVEHKTYWRTHWRQGRQDWVACEHEVLQ